MSYPSGTGPEPRGYGPRQDYDLADRMPPVVIPAPPKPADARSGGAR